MNATEFTLDSDHAKRLIAMGQMAASLAHEIRNPLGSMELFCSLLKKDLANQPEPLKLAEQIHTSIRTLNRVIENCLQFARDISAKKKAVPSAAKLLQEVLDAAEERRSRANVTLTLDASSDGAVFVDSYLVKQALLNLVLNAIDATAQHAEPRTVTVDSHVAENGAWDLSIADNGAGISEEVQQQIFDPFFTTKQQGTGLGLAIVHSIVTAHGATLSLESTVNVGTEVHLHFPSFNVMQKEEHHAGTI